MDVEPILVLRDFHAKTAQISDHSVDAVRLLGAELDGIGDLRRAIRASPEDSDEGELVDEARDLLSPH